MGGKSAPSCRRIFIFWSYQYTFQENNLYISYVAMFYLIMFLDIYGRAVISEEPRES